MFVCLGWGGGGEECGRGWALPFLLAQCLGYHAAANYKQSFGALKGLLPRHALLS